MVFFGRIYSLIGLDEEDESNEKQRRTKLMKDSTTECSDPPSDSEMAVSMVTSGSLKRPAEDMLEPREEPESNPMKLLSTAFMDHKKFKKDDGPYFNNNGLDSDGGSLKPSDQDSEPDHELEKEVRGSEHELPTPTPFPCVWMNGNSPMRSADDHRASLSPQQPQASVSPAPNPAPAQSSFPCVWRNGGEEGGEASPQPPTLPLPPTSRSFPCVWRNGDEGESSPQPPMLQPIEVAPIDDSAPTAPKTPTVGPTESIPMPYKPLVQADMVASSPGEHAASDGEASQGGASPRRTPIGSSPSLTANTTIIDADGQSVEVCPLCQKVFKRKVYLQRHMEREHWSTAKVFKCQDCNYETKHQSNLSVHRRTHTGERPYHCGCCGQRYTQGHLLKSHIRSRHGGNMELYNLEKKSDSSRGRKSLDMKRDLLSSPATFPGAPQPYNIKQEKISSLLAAAAATAATSSPSKPAANSSPAEPWNKYSPSSSFPAAPNAAMSRYMSSLGGYFGSMQPGSPAANAAAAMMNHPMLGAGLLTAPRFFPGLGGLPMSSPSMLPPATAPNLMSALPSMDNGTTTTASSYMDTLAGLKLPVKMPDSDSPSKLSPSKPQSASLVTSPPSPQHKQEDESMPQDLSMKRTTSTPQSITDERRMSNQEEPAPRPQQSPRPSSLPAVPPPEQSAFPSYGPESEEEQDENRAPAAAVSRMLSTSPPCPVDKNCSHEEQLKKLRKNVLRMLSVLTPDIGIENDINFETDQVDQLLYEVIYSNLD